MQVSFHLQHCPALFDGGFKMWRETKNNSVAVFEFLVMLSHHDET